MAGSIPIQLGNATNGRTGPLASSAGDAEPVTGFAAVLSGVFTPGNGPKMPSEVIKLSGLGSLDAGDGLEPPTSGAMKSSDLRPLETVTPE